MSETQCTLCQKGVDNDEDMEPVWTEGGDVFCGFCWNYMAEVNQELAAPPAPTETHPADTSADTMGAFPDTFDASFMKDDDEVLQAPFQPRANDVPPRGTPSRNHETIGRLLESQSPLDRSKAFNEVAEGSERSLNESYSSLRDVHLGQMRHYPSPAPSTQTPPKPYSSPTENVCTKIDSIVTPKERSRRLDVEASEDAEFQMCGQLFAMYQENFESMVPTRSPKKETPHQTGTPPRRASPPFVSPEGSVKVRPGRGSSGSTEAVCFALHEENVNSSLIRLEAVVEEEEEEEAPVVKASKDSLEDILENVGLLTRSADGTTTAAPLRDGIVYEPQPDESFPSPITAEVSERHISLQERRESRSRERRGDHSHASLHSRVEVLARRTHLSPHRRTPDYPAVPDPSETNTLPRPEDEDEDDIYHDYDIDLLPRDVHTQEGSPEFGSEGVHYEPHPSPSGARIREELSRALHFSDVDVAIPEGTVSQSPEQRTHNSAPPISFNDSAIEVYSGGSEDVSRRVDSVVAAESFESRHNNNTMDTHSDPDTEANYLSEEDRVQTVHVSLQYGQHSALRSVSQPNLSPANHRARSGSSAGTEPYGRRSLSTAPATLPPSSPILSDPILALKVAAAVEQALQPERTVAHHRRAIARLYHSTLEASERGKILYDQDMRFIALLEKIDHSIWALQPGHPSEVATTATNKLPTETSKPTVARIPDKENSPPVSEVQPVEEENLSIAWNSLGIQSIGVNTLVVERMQRGSGAEALGFKVGDKMAAIKTDHCAPTALKSVADLLEWSERPVAEFPECLTICVTRLISRSQFLTTPKPHPTAVHIPSHHSGVRRVVLKVSLRTLDSAPAVVRTTAAELEEALSQLPWRADEAEPTPQAKRQEREKERERERDVVARRNPLDSKARSATLPSPEKQESRKGEREKEKEKVRSALSPVGGGVGTVQWGSPNTDKAKWNKGGVAKGVASEKAQEKSVPRVSAHSPLCRCEECQTGEWVERDVSHTHRGAGWESQQQRTSEQSTETAQRSFSLDV